MHVKLVEAQKLSLTCHATRVYVMQACNGNEEAAASLLFEMAGGF